MLICSPFIIFIDSFTSNNWHILVTKVPLVSFVDSICFFLRCLCNTYKNPNSFIWEDFYMLERRFGSAFTD